MTCDTLGSSDIEGTSMGSIKSKKCLFYVEGIDGSRSATSSDSAVCTDVGRRVDPHLFSKTF